jgi:hypothetical protein
MFLQFAILKGVAFCAIIGLIAWIKGAISLGILRKEKFQQIELK